MSAAGERSGPAAARATALIDLGAIERNCRRLASELGAAELCAVVKADGYGHGAVESGGAALAGGAGRLAVAAGAEAVELRAELPDARLLVLGALTAAELDLALAADADVAVWRPRFLELIRARGRALGRRPRVHVKYDTGMGRLGEPDPGAVLGLVEAAAGAHDVELTGLWTHFATADDPGSDFFAAQLERFAGLADSLRCDHPELIMHAANSAATLRDASSHFDMARCGIAIYGLDPLGVDPRARGLESALELRSYVADVKAFEAGWSAGYGRTWRAPEPTQVGVLPIGYGDGVRRGLSNNADVLVGGRRRPVVGTISMDNLTVDLGPMPDVEPGGPAVLIGAQDGERIRAEEVAERLATINYEVTCGISPRVPREYVRT
jgi:alanine racemase